jgi:hypothetical protein
MLHLRTKRATECYALTSRAGVEASVDKFLRPRQKENSFGKYPSIPAELRFSSGGARPSPRWRRRGDLPLIDGGAATPSSGAARGPTPSRLRRGDLPCFSDGRRLPTEWNLLVVGGGAESLFSSEAARRFPTHRNGSHRVWC